MYIHVITVAPEKISTPADIPWRREWRHSANSTPLNKIIVKKESVTIFGCRLIRRSRNVLAIYELPSSNEDQMEFRYKHWCGRAERGRTRARRYSGGTSYGAGGPVMARRNWSHGPNLAADQLLRDRFTIFIHIEFNILLFA